MKSRKVKAAAKSKAFLSKKKLKGSIPLDVSDSGSDVDSESFFHDDIDDFHKGEDDKLSTDDELIQHDDLSSEEEEVLPITDDEKEDSDNDLLEKDESDEASDDDLPNPEAWGKKKSMYYNADFVDEDRGRTYREEDAEAAKAEAEEAFAIQKSVYSNITSDHLGANLFLEGSESSEDEEEKEENITSATRQEKLKFMKKTNPEMFEFFDDFKCSMKDIQDRLLPLLNLANKRKLPTEACAEYIKLKYHLLMHLTMNISFYMTLKSSSNKTSYHPVLQRISSYKKLLDQLKPIDEAVKHDIKIIVDNLQQNKEVTFNVSQPTDGAVQNGLVSESVPSEIIPSAEENLKVKKSKRKIDADTETEQEIVSLINDVKEEQMKKRKLENTEDELQDEPEDDQTEQSLEEKRTITYQIAKNKGLVPHRKKEYRNPRVKHRMKFRKAKIRRKGQVRDVVKEIRRYEGEPTGISTHVVKSRKLK